MGKRKQSRYQQELFHLRRAHGEQSGGDHAFELLVNAAMQDADLLTALVQQGMDVNMLNEKGRSPLYWVIGEADLLAAERLLNQGADPNCCIEGDASPLMYAAYKGDLPLVDLLLQRGAKIDYCDREGDTALSVAAAEGYWAVVERLQQ